LGPEIGNDLTKAVVVVVAVAVLVMHHCHYISEPQYLTTINSVDVELPRDVSICKVYEL